MYFIYDCNGVVVGNPNGYATWNGANRQTKIRSKVSRTIWERFYARVNKEDKLVNSIKLKESK